MGQVFKSHGSRFPLTRTFAAGWVGLVGVAAVLQFQSDAEQRPYLEIVDAKIDGSPWAPSVSHASLADVIRNDAKRPSNVPKEFSQPVTAAIETETLVATRDATFDILPTAPRVGFGGVAVPVDIVPSGPVIQTAQGWAHRITTPTPDAGVQTGAGLEIECLAGCASRDEKPHKMPALARQPSSLTISEIGAMERSKLELPCTDGCAEGETVMTLTRPGPLASAGSGERLAPATGAPGYIVLNKSKPAVSALPMTATFSGSRVTVRPARNFRASTRFDHPAR